MSKEFLVMMNFQEYIEADTEEEAIEIFSDRYDIKGKYLDAVYMSGVSDDDEEESE